MSDIKIFEEHGGVLELTTGKATITFWPQQMEVLNFENTLINPISVKISTNIDEAKSMRKIATPKDHTYFKDRARSSITDIAYSDLSKEDKNEIFRILKKEISSLEKKK